MKPTDPEYQAAFARWLKGEGPAPSPGDDAGGYLVPDNFLDRVRRGLDRRPWWRRVLDYLATWWKKATG